MVTLMLPNVELNELAETIARWVDEVPGVPAVYIFCSRVRGDHRPESDVDIRMYTNKFEPDDATTQWWAEQNCTNFAELKAQLPGPLALHRELRDAADDAISKGRANPVLKVRKAVCVFTPRVNACP